MSEAIIAKRGKSNSNIPGIKQTLITDIITINTTFIVPNAIDNKFHVRIFGGGGGESYANSINSPSGGGSGWMNNGEFILNYGTSIAVKIGRGGSRGTTYSTNGSSGGTSSFGTYLSANGGEGAMMYKGGNGGAGGGGGSFYKIPTDGGTGYQFGGGAGYNGGTGGDGGIWGGGGGAGYSFTPSVIDTEEDLNTRLVISGNGGNGGMYGGGGGAIVYFESKRKNDGELILIKNGGKGGDGGTYGGGGGGYIKGIGGANGGNGSSITEDPENGVNTSGWTNVFNDGNKYFRGNGGKGVLTTRYNVYNSTSGGYDNYNHLATIENYNLNFINKGGGGGGFGGKGGNAMINLWNINNNWTFFKNTCSYLICGGGGGGYGGDGGDSYWIYTYGCGGGGGYGGSGYSTGGGGGGGYGGDGAASTFSGGGGGGGYYTKATLSDTRGASGGAGYASWAAGGGGDGQSGVCIIQYYIWAME